jgi:hypothetical protein
MECIERRRCHEALIRRGRELAAPGIKSLAKPCVDIGALGVVETTLGRPGAELEIEGVGDERVAVLFVRSCRLGRSSTRSRPRVRPSFGPWMLELARSSVSARHEARDKQHQREEPGHAIDVSV